MESAASAFRAYGVGRADRALRREKVDLVVQASRDVDSGIAALAEGRVTAAVLKQSVERERRARVQLRAFDLACDRKRLEFERRRAAHTTLASS